MDYVIERTHILDHDRFLRAGVYARDLWSWGQKYSGKHELDGEIPMSAVLTTPWGYGGRANIKAATKLVEVGLWERTDEGFRSLGWTEQGNKTRQELTLAREASRKKKLLQRARSSSSLRASPPVDPDPCPPGTDQGCPPGSPANVLNSTSYSTSDSDLSRRDPEPDRSPTPRVFDRGTAAATEALAVYAEAVAASTGRPFALPRAPFHTTDLCDALNAHAPPGPVLAVLAWLASTVDAWTRAVDPRFAAGWPPGKLLAWLNAGRPEQRERKSAAETTKQPFDAAAPWMRLGDTGT